jgi:excisionase family DNA binding protein
MTAEAIDYLTVEQAAHELGLPARTVRERVRRGLMAGTKVNARLVLIPREEVEAWRGRGRIRPGRKPPPASDNGEEGEVISPLVAAFDAFRAQFPGGYLFPCAADVIREARGEQDAGS